MADRAEENSIRKYDLKNKALLYSLQAAEQARRQYSFDVASGMQTACAATQPADRGVHGISGPE